MHLAAQVALAHGFARIYALIMLLALLGAMFSLVYSPLKQLIDGTPDDLWSGKMGVTRKEDGMPVNAMWIQCAIVCVLVILVSFGGSSMQQFFLILTAMVNVGMTVPYIFISYAFPKFKKRFFIMMREKIGKMLFFVTLLIRIIVLIVVNVCKGG